MDTKLTLPQLTALSQQCGIPRGALTPLIFSGITETPLPSFWVETNGEFTKEARALLKVLADPQSVNGIAFILPDLIIEGSLCYPDPADGLPQISLLNDGAGLRLQSPIPHEALLSTLRQQWIAGPADSQPISLSLPLLDAWLLWALLDLGRETEKSVVVSLDDLVQTLNRPYDLLQNLAAWFGKALELVGPSAQELEASLQRLEKVGLIVTNQAGGVQAAGMTQHLIREFSDLNVFLMLKTSVILPDREKSLATMRNWIFQGASGLGLLFFVNGEMAELIGLAPVQILNLVECLLQDPFQFFSKNFTVSISDPTHNRLPTPPESL